MFPLPPMRWQRTNVSDFDLEERESSLRLFVREPTVKNRRVEATIRFDVSHRFHYSQTRTPCDEVSSYQCGRRLKVSRES